MNIIFNTSNCTNEFNCTWIPNLRQQHSILNGIKRDLTDLAASPNIKYCISHGSLKFFCRAQLTDGDLKINIYSLNFFMERFPEMPREQFISDMRDYRQIDLNEVTLNIPHPITTTSTKLNLYGVMFLLSPELLAGMAGKRGDDHCISRELLTKCLKKRTKQLKKVPSDTTVEFSHYYKVIAKSGFRILNTLLRRYAGYTGFVVVTAYYPAQSSLKGRLGLTQELFSTWQAEVATVPSC